jgi:hypothetical protein
VSSNIQNATLSIVVAVILIAASVCPGPCIVAYYLVQEEFDNFPQDQAIVESAFAISTVATVVKSERATIVKLCIDINEFFTTESISCCALVTTAYCADKTILCFA